MFKMSEYSFMAGLISVGLALLCYMIAFASVRLARRQSALALEGGPAGSTLLSGETVEVTRGPSGIAGYGSLIHALTGAGLHVFAGNQGSASFGGCWEYHPPRGNGARPERRRRAGDVIVVSAFDLLEGGERTVADVPDEVLAARTRRLVAYPGAVPAVVLGAAF